MTGTPPAQPSPAPSPPAAAPGPPGAAGGPTGLRHGTVQVVPSDPRWPLAYARLAADLAPALGGLATAVEHVGSTSVPGLPAKPIIDIAVLLAPGADARLLHAAVGPLGYAFQGDTGDKGGLLYVLEDAALPDHAVAHLHGINAGDPQWDRYLTLRDLLRADPSARDKYAALKRVLAVRYRNDRPGYTEAKSDFIIRLLTTAAERAEREVSGSVTEPAAKP
ncbi:GrpB family protein [Actinocorallia sp. API 0066]|uniref:GrpB family protein n=1 Tax=Actinocorallia sp. API 0066 TaxID=2896846 RepID=UPI001E32CFB5|nr:GrpB family protein [Actinocorallia sp. API 0066]MCD0451517.1 GrpB family protein [Actinocorallia sp. API 0066]